MSRKPLIKVFDLFLDQNGQWTEAPAAYRGTVLKVAARSSKEAHSFACRSLWVTDSQVPLGILHRCDRGGSPGFDAHRLWCGCPEAGKTAIFHGDGITKIREFMASHRCLTVEDVQ